MRQKWQNRRWHTAAKLVNREEVNIVVRSLWSRTMSGCPYCKIIVIKLWNVVRIRNESLSTFDDASYDEIQFFTPSPSLERSEPSGRDKKSVNMLGIKSLRVEVEEERKRKSHAMNELCVTHICSFSSADANVLSIPHPKVRIHNWRADRRHNLQKQNERMTYDSMQSIRMEFIFIRYRIS